MFCWDQTETFQVYTVPVNLKVLAVQRFQNLMHR